MPVSAYRLGLSELRVGLRHLHAAAYRVVLHGVAGKVDDLPVALDGKLELAFPGKVAFRSVRLHDAVGAARQRIGCGLRRVGRSVPGGGDGHDRLAVGVAAAVHVGAHPRCVDDGELGAFERGVALLACAGLRIDLGDLHAAAMPGEARKLLGAGARVDPEGGEPGRDLVCARADLVPSAPDHLALRPGSEIGVRAVGRLRCGSEVRVGEQDVARDLVFVVVHAAAVVPGVGPHGLVESGGAEGEPHGGGQVLCRARGIRSCRRRSAHGLDAVGDLPVRAHVRGVVSRIGDVATDRDAHVSGGVRGRGDDGDGQRERHHHGHAHDLRGGYPLHRFLFHFSRPPPTSRCSRGSGRRAQRRFPGARSLLARRAPSRRGSAGTRCGCGRAPP